MKRKLTIAVLMGGKSPEHKISLISGKEVVKNLNRKKYNVLPVVIPKNNSLKKLFYIKNKIDVVFIAMHGPNGEDGKMQGFLDLIDMPYTGSGVLASALAMDKIYSRNLFIQSGLDVPKTVVLKKGESGSKVWESLSIPIFVKPRNQGSSVGTSKVKAKKDLEKALKLAYRFDNWAIVEEYLEGTEVTCAILGNQKPKVLPLVEIAPKKEYFDYQAKYDASLTDEIVPARISRSLTKKAQQAALVAYQAVSASGFGRVDMIIKRQKVYVLEVNTIPGLTPVSLFPKAAKAAGITYPKLLDKIIYFAQEAGVWLYPGLFGSRSI